MATGIRLDKENVRGSRLDCEACALGRMTRSSFPRAEPKSDTALQLIHMDVAGPPSVSLTGNLYFATFLKDYSGYSVVRFLKTKEQVKTAVRKVLTYTETQPGEEGHDRVSQQDKRRHWPGAGRLLG